MKKIAFLWPGLPDYGARLIRAFKVSTSHAVEVVATRPGVPIEGMETSLGQRVHWLPLGTIVPTWQGLNLEIPDIVFQGGWADRSLNALCSDAKSAGAKVVLMCDNDWNGSLRQQVPDPIRHRLFLRRRYDAVFTTGQLGREYAVQMGYPSHTVVDGIYGADPANFGAGPPLVDRPRTFLFVGQFVPRKNVLALVDSFVRMSSDHPSWELRLCGSGPLAPKIPRHPRVRAEGFVQPRELSQLMRQVRCLALPSLTDHWPLVVAESTASGLALAMSNTIGSRMDLANDDNAVLFAPRNREAIEMALRTIANWSDIQWQKAETTSRRLSSAYGPARFVAAANQLVEIVSGVTA